MTAAWEVQFRLIILLFSAALELVIPDRVRL